MVFLCKVLKQGRSSDFRCRIKNSRVFQEALKINGSDESRNADFRELDNSEKEAANDSINGADIAKCHKH